ncbi:MAG TPA: response regulator, partial [Hanamia sp.]
MKRVLIVDDNNDILWVVEIILKRYGFEVITTLKGEEVVAKTKKFSPQLILLDVFLSGIDGIEVCNT